MSDFRLSGVLPDVFLVLIWAPVWVDRQNKISFFAVPEVSGFPEASGSNFCWYSVMFCTGLTVYFTTMFASLWYFCLCPCVVDL